MKVVDVDSTRWADLATLFGANGAYSGCWCMWWRLSGKEFSANGNAGNRAALEALAEANAPLGLLAYDDTAATDSARTDSARTNAAGTDTARTNAAGTDTAAINAAGTNAAGTDTARADAARADAGGGRPVGWASLAPRRDFPRLLRSPALKLDEPADETVWSVPCFFIARDRRGTGVASELLAEAIKRAARAGAKVLEGYPTQVDGRAPNAELFTGTPSLFEKAGFTVHKRPASGRRLVVRRAL